MPLGKVIKREPVKIDDGRGGQIRIFDVITDETGIQCEFKAGSGRFVSVPIDQLLLIVNHQRKQKNVINR